MKKQKKTKKRKVCYKKRVTGKEKIGKNGLKVNPMDIIEEERKYLTNEEIQQLKFLRNFKNTKQIVSRKFVV